MKKEELNKIHDNIDIFYFSEHEQLLIIPKYYTNGSSDLTTLINNLTDIENFISHYTGKANNEVYCNEITNSRRYLHKWEFHCEYSSKLELPKNTYVIAAGWTLSQWINF